MKPVLEIDELLKYIKENGTKLLRRLSEYGKL